MDKDLMFLDSFLFRKAIRRRVGVVLSSIAPNSVTEINVLNYIVTVVVAIRLPSAKQS